MLLLTLALLVANAKHFVANNQEASRRKVNVNIDRRTLFEVYYPAFRAAVEAGVGSVMCSCESCHVMASRHGTTPLSLAPPSLPPQIIL